MEDQLNLNGKPVTREAVAEWLLSKRVTLWGDWCVTHPEARDEAVDWFMGQMNELSHA